MKFANINRRAALVIGQRTADIAVASGGRFGPNPMSVYDGWEKFCAWVSTVTKGIGTIRNRCVGRAV